MYNNEMYHYGVKGMKWGVRRASDNVSSAAKSYNSKQKQERQKMAKIAANENAHKYDRKAAKMATESRSKRIAKYVAMATVSTGLKLALGGDIGSMTKDQFVKQVAKEALLSTALNEGTIASVSKKYNDDGRNVKGKENGNALMTREAAASSAVYGAIQLYPVASRYAGYKYSKCKQQRAENEARFNAWGGNILNERYDSIVGVSDSEWRVVK